MAVALVAWAFTTLAEVKEFLGIPPATTTWDDLLSRLINSASSFIQKATDRDLIDKDYDKDVATDRENTWFDGDGSAKQFLRQYPIISVSAVEINGSALAAAGVTDYYGSTGYAIYDRQGLLYYGSGFTLGIQNIRVSYKAGYATGTPEREELRQLCNALVGAIFQTKDKLAFKSERIGLYAYTKADLKGTELFGIAGEEIIFRYKRKWGGK